MSEAQGVILIKASEEIENEVLASGESISFDTVQKIFNFSGLGKVQDYEMLAHVEGKSFSCDDSPSRKKGYVYIEVFDIEWEFISRAIAKYGAGLELYGCIRDEYGSEEFYCLDSNGNRFCEGDHYDEEYEEEYEEECEEIEDGEIRDRWLVLLPKNVKAMLKSVNA